MQMKSWDIFDQDIWWKGDQLNKFFYSTKKEMSQKTFIEHEENQIFSSSILHKLVNPL